MRNLGTPWNLQKGKALLYALLVSLPLYAFPPWNVAGVPIRWDWLVLLLIVFVITFGVARSDWAIGFRKDATFRWLLVFQLFLVFSGLVGTVFRGPFVTADFLTTWVQYVAGGFLFVVATHNRFRRRDIQFILRLYLVVAAIVAGIGVLQYGLANGLGTTVLYLEPWSVKYSSSSPGYVSSLGLRRAQSIFSEPRHFGNYLVTPLILSIATLKLDSFHVFKHDSTPLLLGLLFGGGVLLSFSASSFAILVLTLFALPFLLSEDIRKTLKNLTLPVSGVGSLLMVTVLFDFRPLRFTLQRFWLTPYQRANLFNFDVMLWGFPRYIRGAYLALSDAARYPFAGIGLNQFYNYHPTGVAVVLAPFDLLASVGVFGFVAFYLFLTTLFVRAANERVTHQRTSFGYGVLTVSMLLLVTVILKSTSSSNFQFASTWFWFDVSLAGLLYFHTQQGQ